MSTYSKDPKRSGATGEYAKVTKESNFDSGLFGGAVALMVIGFPWVAFALAIWGIPWMWGEALSSYAGWGIRPNTRPEGSHTPAMLRQLWLGEVG